MSAAPVGQSLTPKLVTTLREGYSLGALQRDATAGLTVAIVALPLSLALAIASGTTPDRGLVTAIIAGFLISLLGGSRVQIGGPTGAFVVVVFNVIAQHGYDGLLVATALAGLILVAAGLLRLGTWVKYIPQPVITGFTAGIALVIFSSQVKDLLGLQMDSVPADFIAKWMAYARALPSLEIAALAIALGSLGAILLLRRFAPRLPGFLIAVAGASLVSWALTLDIATIGSRFGALPSTLPMPAIPEFSWAQIKAVLPSAFTIAFLAGIESLLSAVIADGMTGRRHRSNAELVAQGAANLFSTLFGGMPATGAIARTATNIRAGAQSPIAGMLHAAFLLVFMFLLGPLIAQIPLASLAAVLVIVAWNMSEIDHIRHLLRAPMGERIILVLTFTLTVLVDLTVAIGVGVVLAALMFMHRMAGLNALRHSASLDESDDPVTDTARKRAGLPAGVELFELRGPLFFGVAEHLMDVLQRTGPRPRAYVINLREVPLVDATGAKTLLDFIERCARHRISVVLVGLQPSVSATLTSMHALSHANATVTNTLDEAIALAASAASGNQAAKLR